MNEINGFLFYNIYENTKTMTREEREKKNEKI
jgi:hypothetical protein